MTEDYGISCSRGSTLRCLDHGQYRLRQRDQECLGSGDGVEAGRTVLEFSTKQTCVGRAEQEAFLEEMDAVFLERCRGYHTVRSGQSNSLFRWCLHAGP